MIVIIYLFQWRSQDSQLVHKRKLNQAHVQYTQTDTIRQTDGPLVPIVQLVPIETDVIPMVLLVNMHLIKGT